MSNSDHDPKEGADQEVAPEDLEVNDADIDQSSEDTIGYIAQTTKRKISRFSSEHENALAANPLELPEFVEMYVRVLKDLHRPDGEKFSFLPPAGRRKEKARSEKNLMNTWLRLTFKVGGGLAPVMKSYHFLQDPRRLVIEMAMEEPECAAWFRKQPEFSYAYNNENFTKMMGSGKRAVAAYIAFQIFSHPGLIKRIPKRILLAISTPYADFLEQQRENFAKEYPQLVKKTKRHLYDAIDRGDISVSKEKVDKVLERIETHLTDPITMQLEDAQGRYLAENQAIFLDATTTPEQREKTFMHEVLHALSGLTLFSNEEYQARALRVGLHFYGKKSEFEWIHKFGWLNEGITEALTLKVLQLEDADKRGVYKEERKLLKLLCESVDSSLFQDAYFEEFDPQAATDQRIPAWRKLTAALEQKFGPHFLTRLDAFIKKTTGTKRKFWEEKQDRSSGVAAAVAKFTELGDQFPQFLEEQVKMAA